MNTNRDDFSAIAVGDFASAVRASFEFLETLGFKVAESLPTIVKYERDGVEVVVYYEPFSHEIDLALTAGPERYSMAEILRVSDPSVAKSYRSWAAATADSMRTGTRALASLLAEHGSRCLIGEADFLERLRTQRLNWSESYELAVLEAQVRPLAEDAFRAGRYADAVALYGRIAHSLTPSERKKVAFAMRHSAGAEG